MECRQCKQCKLCEQCSVSRISSGSSVSSLSNVSSLYGVLLSSLMVFLSIIDSFECQLIPKMICFSPCVRYMSELFYIGPIYHLAFTKLDKMIMLDSTDLGVLSDLEVHISLSSQEHC